MKKTFTSHDVVLIPYNPFDDHDLVEFHYSELNSPSSDVAVKDLNDFIEIMAIFNTKEVVEYWLEPYP